MSVQLPASRRSSRSVGAAGVGLLVTLVIFVGVFVTFLVAPLVALLVAYLGYTVMKPRAARPAPAPAAGDGDPDQPDHAARADLPAHGFGAGTR
jgi:phosphate/sulfate permease